MDENAQQNTQPQKETITAEFTGGDGSEGYKTGETYTLNKWEENNMIFISREDGSGQVAYDSMDSLQNNWKMAQPSGGTDNPTPAT